LAPPPLNVNPIFGWLQARLVISSTRPIKTHFLIQAQNLKKDKLF